MRSILGFILCLTAVSFVGGSECTDTSLSLYVTDEGHIRARFSSPASVSADGYVHTPCGLKCACLDSVFLCCSDADCIQMDQKCETDIYSPDHESVVDKAVNTVFIKKQPDVSFSHIPSQNQDSQVQFGKSLIHSNVPILVQHINDPVQLIQDPVQHIQDPVQHIQDPAHIQDPVQLINDPVQLIQDPVKHIQVPVQHVQDPVQLIQDPVQLIQDPVQLIQDPVQLIQDPVHIQDLAQHIQVPVQLVEDPVKVNEHVVPVHKRSIRLKELLTRSSLKRAKRDVYVEGVTSDDEEIEEGSVMSLRRRKRNLSNGEEDEEIEGGSGMLLRRRKRNPLEPLPITESSTSEYPEELVQVTELPETSTTSIII